MMDNLGLQKSLHAFQLTMPTRLRSGVVGERIGVDSGSSAEFHDYREYVPGDDVRHIDWSAYARSDELFVRLHREEITPQVDLIVDGSASMRSSDEKMSFARGVALFFSRLCQADRLACTLWLGHDQLDRVKRDHGVRLESHPFESRGGLEASFQHLNGMAKNGIRIVISDFLFPVDVRAMCSKIAKGTSATWFLQVLSQDEIDPEVESGRRLQDIETKSIADLVLDEATVAQYRSRLAAHQEKFRVELKRLGGLFLTMNTAEGLYASLKNIVLPTGLIVPRGQAS